MMMMMMMMMIMIMMIKAMMMTEPSKPLLSPFLRLVPGMTSPAESSCFPHVSVSAPGKVILFGEHAVVHGVTAVAAALSLRTSVRFTPLPTATLRLVLLDYESVRPTFEWPLAHVDPLMSQHEPPPHAPTSDTLASLTALVQTPNKAPLPLLFLYSRLASNPTLRSRGVEVTVKSSIPLGAGLGSSAAYCVALAGGFLAAAHGWKTFDLPAQELVNAWGHEAEKILHGKPSGIDNSVSAFGGVLSFQRESGVVHIPSSLPVRLILVDTRVPHDTRALVEGVRQLLVRFPSIIQPLFDAVEAISTEFRTALAQCTHFLEQTTTTSEDDFVRRDKTITAFHATMGELVDVNHNILNALGVGHPALEDVVTTARQYHLHAKLTGAGGGGCALVVVPNGIAPTSVLDLEETLRSKGYQVVETDVESVGITFTTST